MRLLPSIPLTSLVKAYFAYAGIPVSLDDEDDEDTEPVTTTDEDAFDAMLVSVVYYHASRPSVYFPEGCFSFVLAIHPRSSPHGYSTPQGI